VLELGVRVGIKIIVRVRATLNWKKPSNSSRNNFGEITKKNYL